MNRVVIRMDYLAKTLINQFGGRESPQSWVGIHVPTELEQQAGLWITKAGMHPFLEGFSYDAAGAKRHYEWGAVIDGEMEISTGGTTAVLTEGMYYLFPQDVSFEARTVKPVRLAWFECCGPLCPMLLDMLDAPVGKYNYGQLKQVMGLAWLLHHRPANYRFQLHSRFWAFLGASCAAEEKLDPQIRLALDHISANAQDPSLSNASLARTVMMPQETFRKKFARQVGRTPMQQLQQTRITLAKELLCDTDRTVRQIAFDCGFTDPYYFSRVFKEMEGLSPVQFRKDAVFKSY